MKPRLTGVQATKELDYDNRLINITNLIAVQKDFITYPISWRQDKARPNTQQGKGQTRTRYKNKARQESIESQKVGINSEAYLVVEDQGLNQKSQKVDLPKNMNPSFSQKTNSNLS